MAGSAPKESVNSGSTTDAADLITPMTYKVNGTDVVLAARPSMQDPVSVRIRTNWSPDAQVRLAIQLLGATDRYLDLGASVGTFCIPVSKVTQSRCLAIEALPSNLPILQYAIDHNGLQGLVEWVHCAIMDKNGEVLISGIGSHGRVGTGKRVISYSLDSLMDDYGLSGVRLVKMDIEGCELKALEGATRFLHTNPACIYIFEANGAHCHHNGYAPQDLLRVFERIGLNIYLISGSLLARRTAADFQEFGNVDYVAAPFALEDRIEGFTFGDLDEAQKRQLVVKALTVMNPGYRRFMAAQIESYAPPSIRDDPDVRRSMEGPPSG